MPLNPQPAKESAAKAFNAFNLAAFTIGTKATNTIKVTVQLKDARGHALGIPVQCTFYLASTADGLTLSPTVTTSALAIAAKGTLLWIELTGLGATLVSDITGTFDINLIQTAGGTNYYMVVILPDGGIVVSPIISF